MIILSYSARDFADAMRALLPPGAAWDWPADGVGDALMVAMGQELARISDGRAEVLIRAVDIHRPASCDFSLSQYRAVAVQAIAGVVEAPRKMFAVGGRVGDRVWSASGAGSTWPVALVSVDPIAGPPRVGSQVGCLCWSSRSRVMLRVRYYCSVVDPRVIWDALQAFKQAHVVLWFEDVTGSGGGAFYG